ncbi:unnamed protein product [Bursaphelenchus okinawaensis]|uniref:BUD13 homolog n=1 Tax=Bursaphelenchus okinawaensis TaxID=465554 RepID=A0A811JR03_9BILA|nr:unnamed protein product [Bursaphelenchus okinawaensis]CAG9079062.1 unnamed protein product [Bursaphelenchus okinawaensis]
MSISKQDYLKRYLDGPTEEKKKKKSKKTKKSAISNGIRILDEDAFMAVAPTRGPREDIESDEDDEEDLDEIVLREYKSKGFKETFATVEVKQEEASPSKENQNDSRRKRDDSEDEEVPRRKRHDSDEDLRRRRRHDFDEEVSRRLKNTKIVKEEPVSSRREKVRAQTRHDSDDEEVPRRRRKDSDDDVSRGRHDDHKTRISTAVKVKKESESPRRHDDRRRTKKREDSDEEVSRRRRRHDSDEDVPRKRNRHDSDEDVPRRRARKDSDQDLERKKGHDSDEEVPRKRHKDLSDEEVPKRRRRHDSKGEKVSKTEKKKAGLLSREDMRRHEEEAATEHSIFNDAEKSGKYAEAVHRDSNYGKRKKETKEDKERSEREAKVQQELNDKYKQVSKGVVQQQKREEKKKEMAEVLQEGFTRYRDDEAMNEYMKDKIIDEDDPLADMMQKKQMKIRMKSELVYPTYKGHFPPNRFNIPPGYRWDGVNRSNRFEDKLARRANDEEARQKAVYRIQQELNE